MVGNRDSRKDLNFQECMTDTTDTITINIVIVGTLISLNHYHDPLYNCCSV